MTYGVVPDDAAQFLLRMIDSVAQWEGLLLLRTHPDMAWDIPAVARQLYVSEDETRALLAKLVERKILALEGDIYAYKPHSPELDELIGRCAELYRTYLIPVTKIIHSKPGSIQAFADAFRLRKE